MEKFRRHARVHLRVPQTDMAEIDRQVMQESWHVGALLIPRRKTVNGECMTKVMNPRLLARVVGSTDPCIIAQNAKDVLECIRLDGDTRPRREEGSLARSIPRVVFRRTETGSCLIVVQREQDASCRTSYCGWSEVTR